ncbi:hypothetical protein [Amycolatopsis sp. NPDC000740]|uniref:hypothetical protein n=1 Tax=Amycolatopsis sp. NPDC000740 TaxID=3154269 RepID=UPI00331DCAF7
MRLWPALAALLLIASCSAPAAQTQAPQALPAPDAPLPLGTNGTAVPKLDWTPCHGGFQCATAPVPLSYREPGGAKLNLSVIRMPATDPAPGAS